MSDLKKLPITNNIVFSIYLPVATILLGSHESTATVLFSSYLPAITILLLSYLSTATSTCLSPTTFLPSPCLSTATSTYLLPTTLLRAHYLSTAISTCIPTATFILSSYLSAAYRLPSELPAIPVSSRFKSLRLSNAWLSLPFLSAVFEVWTWQLRG